jgi:alpha-glucosidase (family GH31 glycosyl hydrolase)
MFHRFTACCIVFLISAGALAQQSIGSYQSGFSKRGNQFHFTNIHGDVLLEFCTPAMFRVRESWNRNFEANERWMVVKYDWAEVALQYKEYPGYFDIRTGQLQLKIYKSPYRIEVYDKRGKLLSSEKENKTGGAYKNADTIACAKQLFPDEHFFGFGERMDFIDQRSKRLRMNVGRGKGLPHVIGAYNILEANYSPIPFFMSTRGYGIFFHNAFPTEWDMGATNGNEYFFSAAGGELDYYFIYGPGLPAVLNQYTLLTGRSPLLPRFALGLHVGTYSGGTWGYEALSSDAYVIALAKKLRELGIPADLLWLDSTWRIFGKAGGTGATSFEWRETFKNPAALFDSLYALQYKMVGLHLRPRFDNGNTINLLDTAQEFHYTYPERKYAGEFVNFFDTAAVNWWWNHGVMRVAAIGAKFLKTDEGSAFGALANESNKTGPTGKDIPKLHNLFPLAYAKAPYEKFQVFNGIRGLNHTREGYAGIQRYPFIFAGDWPSEWQYFPAVIKAGLNIGISGVGYWGHCMGGFEHNADPELYIRWCQFGMFSPVAMVFGMDHPGYKEPWNYGEDALRNFKKYDSLRYRLLPYLYSAAWQQYQGGIPLMRALVLQYQDDENVYNIGDQYLLGDNMMVCPVTVKGAQTRTVYFPEGEWYNYWTGKRYTGKQYANIVTTLDTLPLFVKAGAVIPMQPAMNYVGEKPAGTITLDIFPGKGKLELYEDDGTSLAYQQGKFAVTTIKTEPSVNGLAITIGSPEGKFRPAAPDYLTKVRMPSGPAGVTGDGRKLERFFSSSDIAGKPGWYYDAVRQELWIKTGNANYADENANIPYHKIIIFKN